jgi:hypothetical protein
LELEENTEVIPLCEGFGWTRLIAADNIIVCNRGHSEVTKENRKSVDAV